MLQQVASFGAPGRNFVAGGGVATAVVSGAGPNVDAIEMQEKSLEFMAQQQKHQREALARVLTPEQLKVVEDEQNSQLLMQRAQIRMMRAQQEAGLLDPAQSNGIGYIQDGIAIATPVAD